MTTTDDQGRDQMEQAQDMLSPARRRAHEQPDDMAFVDYDTHTFRDAGRADPTRVTYAEFWARSMGLAAGLRARGIARGDVVAVQLPNRHEAVMFHLALHSLGAITMPISPIYRERDLARQLQIAQAVALVEPATYGSHDHLAMGDTVRRKVDSLRLGVCVGAGGGGFFTPIDELVDEGSSDPQSLDLISAGALVPGTDDPMMLNFTSGTTGEPKGVVHSYATVASSVMATMDRLEVTGADTLFVAATVGHAGGFLNGVFMPLLAGPRVVFVTLWDAGVALRVLTDESVTYAAMMPPHIIDLVEHDEFEDYPLPRWRTARVSGGPIPRAMLDRLHGHAPGLRLCPGWGMSETLYVTCAGPQDPVDRRSSTDGRPVGRCAIEIRGTDDVTALPAHQVGQVMVRAPSTMLRYENQAELTRTMYTPDGWLKTGDLGEVDEEGFLTIRGRLKDLVLRGGENVPVVEVERLLAEHEHVLTATVVGVPDPRLGERVCAVITSDPAHPALTMQEMKDYLAARGLTRQFIPEHLVLCEELPRTASGKVRKHDVRRLALHELGLDLPTTEAPHEKEMSG